MWAFVRDFESALGSRATCARDGVRAPSLAALEAAVLAPTISPMLDAIFERLVGLLLDDRDAAIQKRFVSNTRRWSEYMRMEDGELEPYSSGSEEEEEIDLAAAAAAGGGGASPARVAAATAAAVAAARGAESAAEAAAAAASASAAAPAEVQVRGRPTRGAAQVARQRLKDTTSELHKIDISLGLISGSGKGKQGRSALKLAKRLAEATEDAREFTLKRRKASRSIATHTRVGKTADDNWDRCSVCFGAGELMCCDGCPQGFHPRCVGMRAVPDGRWLCPSCTTCGAAYFPDAATDRPPAAAEVLSWTHRSVVHILTRRMPMLGARSAATLATRVPLRSLLSRATWPAMLRRLLCEKNGFDRCAQCLRLLTDLEETRGATSQLRVPLSAAGDELVRTSTAVALENEVRAQHLVYRYIVCESFVQLNWTHSSA